MLASRFGEHRDNLRNMLCRFLKYENHHAMYTHLVLAGKLWKHLEEVDMECNDMMDRLTAQVAEREGVTEQLKSADQPGWVWKMNSIRSGGSSVA